MGRRVRIEALMRTWRRARSVGDARDDAVARVMGVGRSDARALEALEDGALPVKELAAACGMSANAMTTVVDRLAAQGYVERRPDEADRRRIHVHRTAFADSVRARIFAPVSAWAAEALGGFDDDQLGTLTTYLEGTLATTQRHLDYVRELDPARVRAEAKTDTDGEPPPGDRRPLVVDPETETHRPRVGTGGRVDG